MSKQQNIDQESKLKELAKKPVSDEIKQSIKEKQKHINKPLNK